MPPAIIGGAIGGVGSIISGIMGSNAAQQAAKEQEAAAKAAAANTQQAVTTSTNQQTQATGAQTANQQPFITGGQGAFNNLSNLLQSGQLGQSYAQQNGQFTAPTAAQAQATPGYQFQLQQGLNALQNSAAARGGLLSTGTAKNLNNYAQGVASTNYQNTYGNALNAYNENANVYNTGQNNLYNMLYGTSALGQNSASNLNSNLQAGANNLANINMGGAQQVGQDLTGAGNAAAAGTVGSANALTGAIGGVANGIGQGITLQGLLGPLNASNTGANFASRGAAAAY